MMKGSIYVWLFMIVFNISLAKERQQALDLAYKKSYEKSLNLTSKKWRQLHTEVKVELVTRLQLVDRLNESYEEGKDGFHRFWTSLSDAEQVYIKDIIKLYSPDYKCCDVKFYKYKNMIVMGRYITQPNLELRELSINKMRQMFYSDSTNIRSAGTLPPKPGGL